MARWLVVNADDLGVSKGATLGVIRAHREGIVTSASLAVTTRFYDSAVQSCVRTCPDLGIGLHFTLTSGRPVSDARTVPLLMGTGGFFRWRFLSLLAAMTLPGRRDLLTQVDVELEAQLARLAADGIRPDHIDSERHVHLIPGIFEKVVAAARRHGIRFVRAGSDIGTRSFPVATVPGLAMRGGFAKSWLLSELAREGRRHLGNGIRSVDLVGSYFGSGRMHLVKRGVLARSSANGITEIMVHPGIPEESAGIDEGNRELHRYLQSQDRVEELGFCVDARRWVDDSILTNYSRLVKEWSSP